MTNNSETQILHHAREQARLTYSDLKLRNDLTKSTKWINELAHFCFEKSSPSFFNKPKILELGASSDINLYFCNKNYSSYTLSDIDTTILNNLNYTHSLSKYENIYIRSIDATKLGEQLSNEKFDRIIACNLLEHLPNPELVLIDWMNSLNSGGVLSLLQPCDPGLLWRFGRNLGHRQHCISLGINYDLISALEHINAANNVIAIIESLFKNNSKISFFPFKIKSWNFNLFFYAHITKM